MLFRVSKVCLCVALLPAAVSAGGFEGTVAEPAIAPVTLMPVAQGLDWSGVYVGGSYGRGQILNDAGTVDSADTSLYGIHAGKMWDLGHWVTGVELEYQRLNPEDDTSIDAHAIRAKGRLGYDFGRIQPYATMGGAAMIFTGAFEGTDAAVVYGGGIDFALSDSLIVGAEVLQHDVVGAFGDSDLDVSAQTLSLRASFKF